MNVIIFGLPGSGKTCFARKLSSKINALHISSDTIRHQLKQGDKKYQEQSKSEVYEEMLRLMEKAVLNKQNVVLDATFYRSAIRNSFKEKAQRLNTSLYFIEIKADESVVRERIKAKRQESDADFKVYLQIKKVFEPFNERHLVLYSDKNTLEEMLNEALTYINYSDGTS